MAGVTKTCTNCKREVAVANHTVHVVHCLRNVALCPVCAEPVPRAQFQQHLQAAHGTLDCAKCGEKIQAVAIFAHQHEECPRRLMACQYCELEVCAAEMAKHTEYCGSRTERCKGCTKYVQFRHLQFHYSSDHKYLAPEDKDKHAGTDSGDEGSEECPVCLGPITLPIALECGHVFCMVCVKGIANTTKNCAICRRDIARDMLMDIRFCREEDVIKNYVNKPRDCKKAFRSHSVPTRVQAASSGRRATTQDYDDMVSHLLSSRTSSTPYRYQRPNNGHTPASYTPYSYPTTTSTNNTSTDSTNTNTNDDCCCSSSAAQSSAPNNNNRSSSTTSPSPITASRVSPKPLTSSTTTTTTTSPSGTVTSTAVHTAITEPSSDSKPRRPTSLALSSSLNESTPPEPYRRNRREPPPNATQEQYDRWLAFQLAQAEDDVSAAEFNKKHRPVIGRSQSMPERAIISVTHRAGAASASSDSSDTSDEEDDHSAPSSGGLTKRGRPSSSRPPASPRTLSSQTSGGASQAGSSGNTSSYSSSSSLSASSRSPSLSKSSSDSSASGPGGGSSSVGSGISSGSSGGSSRISSTGTRPKSSTGLKKRVSFKEEAPEERRVAPIMLPCEFCDEMFPERDLMRHQTSCDLNETQMPRVRRDSITSPIQLNSPTMNLNSPSATSRSIPSSASPAPNSNLSSPVSPTSRRKTPPNLPVGSSKRTDHSKSSLIDSHRTPPTSPPPRPPHPPHSCHHQTSSPNTHSSNYRIRSSPQPTNTHELTDSSSDSRPTSVSPCPPHSNSSCSSGISSMASSTRSVSSTPSSSSSASPIPAVVDTPTDIEADFEDDDTPFVKPRRGKLLSSAICSWRTMSGSRDRPRYTRSNTAPLEDTGEDSPEPNLVLNSHSASQLPPLPPRPESTPAESDQSSPDFPSSTSHPSPSQHKPRGQQVFIKRQKKYRAPPPPTQTSQPNQTSVESIQSSDSSTTTQQKTDRQDLPAGSFFRLDSKPMMNHEMETDTEPSVPCEICKQVFSPEKFQIHKPMCERAPNTLQPFREGVSLARAPSQPPDTSSSARASYDPFAPDASESPTPTYNQFRRYERAQSVLDDRCLEGHRGRSNSSLQRAHSIKEGSRGRPVLDTPTMGRRWSSRETLFSQRGEPTSPGSSMPTYGGSTFGSGSSRYSSRGWSDHVSMVQDDVKAKLTSAKALLYDREKKSDSNESEVLRPGFIADLRTWLDKTNPSSNLPTMGSSRYRSSSIARPSSIYNSSGFGSTTRLNSLDHRTSYDATSPRTPFSAADSFGSAFRRRYVR